MTYISFLMVDSRWYINVSYSLQSWLFITYHLTVFFCHVTLSCSVWFFFSSAILLPLSLFKFICCSTSTVPNSCFGMKNDRLIFFFTWWLPLPFRPRRIPWLEHRCKKHSSQLILTDWIFYLTSKLSKVMWLFNPINVTVPNTSEVICHQSNWMIQVDRII